MNNSVETNNTEMDSNTETNNIEMNNNYSDV